jgi:hypothetical protein
MLAAIVGCLGSTMPSAASSLARSLRSGSCLQHYEVNAAGCSIEPILPREKENMVGRENVSMSIDVLLFAKNVYRGWVRVLIQKMD